MSYIFGGKNGKCLNAKKMYGLNVKEHGKQKNVNSLQKGCTEFLKLLQFSSKTQNFYFSNINAYKIQNFQLVLRNWNICYKIDAIDAML